MYLLLKLKGMKNVLTFKRASGIPSLHGILWEVEYTCVTSLLKGALIVILFILLWSQDHLILWQIKYAVLQGVSPCHIDAW